MADPERVDITTRFDTDPTCETGCSPEPASTSLQDTAIRSTPVRGKGLICGESAFTCPGMVLVGSELVCGMRGLVKLHTQEDGVVLIPVARTDDYHI